MREKEKERKDFKKKTKAFRFSNKTGITSGEQRMRKRKKKRKKNKEKNDL